MTSFVPFKQERDKLGRLISKENKFSEQSLRFSSSCQLSGKNFVRRQELTEREKSTDNRVEKIFKVNSIPAIHSARDKTLRITTSQSKKNIVPAVGQYDFAAVADKVKYSRAKMAEIKAKPSMPSISLPTKH